MDRTPGWNQATYQIPVENNITLEGNLSLPENPRGVVLKATDAKQAEDCFWQAFQKCSPASLVYTLASVDTVTIRTFTIQSNGDHCSPVDAVQHTIVPAPLSAAKTYTCTGVTHKPDGLHFSSCGVDGDVVVSLQARPNP